MIEFQRSLILLVSHIVVKSVVRIPTVRSFPKSDSVLVLFVLFQCGDHFVISDFLVQWSVGVLSDFLNMLQFSDGAVVVGFVVLSTVIFRSKSGKEIEHVIFGLLEGSAEISVFVTD